MRQIQPIREMARATRAYAAGNFDVRMQDTGRNDEIGELAASFNNMADSLAETARVCGISVPAVKSQLYRTRQGLRTYLEKEGFDV